MYALTKRHGSCRGPSGSDMHKQTKNNKAKTKTTQQHNVEKHKCTYLVAGSRNSKDMHSRTPSERMWHKSCGENPRLMHLRSARRPCTTSDAKALTSLRETGRWQRLPRAELKSHTSTSSLPSHAVPRQREVTAAAICTDKLSMGTMASIVRFHQRDSISTAKGWAKVQNNAT